MRLIVVLAAGALGAAACSPAKPAEAPAAVASTTAEIASAEQETPQQAPPPDDTARGLAAAETAAGITPDAFTFHTAPKKIEIVRLPLTGGGVWSAEGYAEAHVFDLLDSKDETTAKGAKVHAVRFEMVASGNGRVIFQKRASDNPNDPVLDVRTVHFMIH